MPPLNLEDATPKKLLKNFSFAIACVGIILGTTAYVGSSILTQTLNPLEQRRIFAQAIQEGRYRDELMKQVLSHIDYNKDGKHTWDEIARFCGHYEVICKKAKDNLSLGNPLNYLSKNELEYIVNNYNEKKK